MLLQPSNPDISISELPTTNLWYPGRNTTNRSSSPPLSSRAEEIARSKEEMMSLLKDVPESDYELSLTDLVEKKLAVREKEQSEEQKDSSSLSKRGKDWRKKRNRNSFRSSSDGVLLNFFMPVSLTRSSTIPRGRRGIAQRDLTECNNRESEAGAIWKGCWPVFLHRRRHKSKESKTG